MLSNSSVAYAPIPELKYDIRISCSVTLLLLKRRQPIRTAPKGQHYITAGFSELKGTFTELFKLKSTLRFLIAYLLYNDGIQTVIAMSAVFLSQELFEVCRLEGADNRVSGGADPVSAG